MAASGDLSLEIKDLIRKALYRDQWRSTDEAVKT
jgi:hypothetical protein